MLDLKANEITADVSGAGNLNLKGTAQLLDAKISGAGDLKSYNLQTEKTKLIVSGSGTAKVNTTQALDADVSGAGTVIYKGEPTDRNVNISGAGSVRQAKGENEKEINESLKNNGDTTRLKLGDRHIMIYGDDDDETKKGGNTFCCCISGSFCFRCLICIIFVFRDAVAI